MELPNTLNILFFGAVELFPFNTEVERLSIFLVFPVPGDHQRNEKLKSKQDYEQTSAMDSSDKIHDTFCFNFLMIPSKL